MKTIAERLYRIGLQKLLYDEKQDQYYVSIRNRSYSSRIPIPKDKAEQWRSILEHRGASQTS